MFFIQILRKEEVDMNICKKENTPSFQKALSEREINAREEVEKERIERLRVSISNPYNISIKFDDSLNGNIIHEFKKQLLRIALERNDYNRTRAAKDLGLTTRTVRTMIQDLKAEAILKTGGLI